MLSRIKRGVGWSRRPPMHVGSRDARAERRPRVLNPTCASACRIRTHTQVAWVGRCVQCGAAVWEAQARLRAAILMRPVWGSVFARVVMAAHIIRLHTHIRLRGLTTSPDFNDAENTHNRETQSQIHYISILNGRRHSLAFHLCRRTRFAVLARERGRDHASLAAHL